MPARSGRSSTFHCDCFICNVEGPTDSNGTPLGRDLPLSIRSAHQNRIKAESLRPNNAANLEEISSSIFTSTVLGESSLRLQPSRLWASREENQDRVHPSNITSDDPPIDDILRSIQRLNLDSTDRNSHPSPVATGSFLSLDASDNSVGMSLTNRTSKKEKSNLTTKAHLSLDKIDDCIKSCLIRIDSPGLSFDDILHLQEEIGGLRQSLDSVGRNVHSINVRRQATTASLNGIATHLEKLQKQNPIDVNVTLKYNADNHFDAPINGNDPVAQITMFIVVLCTVMSGISRRMGDLLLGLLSILLRFSFSAAGEFDDWQKDVLQQLPRTAETVLSKFPLASKTIIYAVCPACNCTYPPTFSPGSNTPIYPEQCSNIPYPSEPCSETLLEVAIDGRRLPIKTFEYHSFHDYLATLLSRYDLEDAMDQACDKLASSVNRGEHSPTFVSDIFDAEFVRNFRGPDNKYFIDRPGNEGRYLFVLNVDFFAAERQTVRGPSASCGLISAACLNLPLFIRYLPENMYVAGIIPGPNEPKETQLNHFMRPLVDDLKISWESGVEYSRTAKYLKGRSTRSAVAVSVNDLPAARKVNQSIGHTSHKFCTRCSCCNRTRLDRTDVEHADWLPKDVSQLRKDAEAWRTASTIQDQKKLLDATGLRWTELWRLPYWDPTCMLGVDSMHCLLEGISQQHFRDILRLTDADAKEPGPREAFEFEFVPPPDGWPSDNSNSRKHVAEIHRMLVAPLREGESDQDAIFRKLAARLNGKNRAALNFVTFTNLDLKPQPSTQPLNVVESTSGQKVYSKQECIDMLVAWRKTKPLNAPAQIRYGSIETMERIREVIRDMDTPSWLESVPYNFGMASAGSLKADEWRTVTTVHLPVALVSLWGEGTVHPSAAVGSALRVALDHTMNLVCAVSLACMRTMSPSRMNAYRMHITAWLSKLRKIHPTARVSTNWHSAVHMYDFLLLFGPVRSWWCFPFERLIGQLQRLPHNHKFGQLESTMLLSFLRGARLRHWLSRPDCPSALKECKTIFDSAFGKQAEVIASTMPDNPSSYQIVPEDLATCISEAKVRLRARYIHDNTVYTRSSLHIGNSLVMFYPNGNRSKKLVPGCIKYIIDEEQRKQFVVNRQLPAPSRTVDPFQPYRHFPAEIYSTKLSPELELISPEWVESHYARWGMDADRAVVLRLSRD